MGSAETSTLFSAVSSVEPTAAGPLEATVDPLWTIGGKPNGGYLLATLGRAAATVSPHPHLIAASSYYLHAPSPGPVAIDVELLREGRSASHVRARMSQGDRACIEALFIASMLDPGASPYWDRGVPEPGMVAYEECPRLIPSTPDGLPVAIMEQVEVRLEPGSRGFTHGEPSGSGELRGWLALPGGEGFDPVSLLFAVDAFPPATFEIEYSGWVPTLELSVYVRALPRPGPVRVLHRAHLIDGQRVDETCHIWDSGGRLVAQGQQLAGVRLG